VLSVYDGDTLTLTDKKRVRFLGIDTPELCNPVQAFSEEAKQYTVQRCLQQQPIAAATTTATKKKKKDNKNKIWISYEPGQDTTDKYGRLLAWVWVQTHDPSNGKKKVYECVNEGLLLEGLATVYTPSRQTKLETFHKLIDQQKYARIQKRGLWKNWNDNQKVLQTKFGCAFHALGGSCEHLKRSNANTLIVVLEREALDQGLHACRTCLAEEEGTDNHAKKKVDQPKLRAVSVY